MKLVIFGLTVSSSWGNGHATLWRGLLSAWTRRGHDAVFFERDVPYYACHRDLTALAGCDLVFYPDFEQARRAAADQLRDAQVAMVTSYCPDGIAAAELVLESQAELKVFYDLDTPVTLADLAAGRPVPYLGPRGLAGFDLVLSYTGGKALDELCARLGASKAAPLYGHVDPARHYPAAGGNEPAADLTYLGTYAPDRQPHVEELLFRPARLSPERQFVVGGAMYPDTMDWPLNVRHLPHVAPADHPAFFCSGLATLNVTRAAMATMGFCPSGRLFEAAACRTATITDAWEGLDRFFEPGREILVCETAAQVVDALKDRDLLQRVARAAYERALAEHTSEHRCAEMEGLFERALAGPATEEVA